jgi:uncharacterized membrane protein YhhN
MMPEAMILAAAVLLLAVLLFFEKRQDRRGLVPAKTALSCLFVLVALIQPHLHPAYFYVLLVGLVFCLGGDIFLALPQRSMFRCGLLAFLLGHVFYIVAFFHVGRTGPWTWISATVCAAGAVFVYRWLSPRLGSMKLPVLAYIVVISVMVVGAASLAAAQTLATPARILVAAGALCFYVSDVFVARDRFLRSRFENRLIGLPLYYAGQFMLAFSIGFLR